MRKTPSLIAAAAGVLVTLCVPPAAAAQASPSVIRIASLAPGAISGQVQDELGVPVPGAVVSAVGSNSAFAVSDRAGRFELRPLPPGPYLVRAHLTGFVAPRGQVVRVLPSARASSSIALRHVSAVTPPAPPPPLQAGVGGAPPPHPPRPADPPPPPPPRTRTPPGGSGGQSPRPR